MNLKQYKIILICIGYVLFFYSLFNGFVYDDSFQIVTNEFVQKGDYLHYFYSTTGENPHYRPLMFTVFTFLFQLFNLNAFFYHLFQVTIHILNTLLLFLLFRHISKNLFLSFCFSLLFLVHPINVETVVYISDLQDILFVFCGLSALYIGIKQKFGKYSNISVVLLLFFSLLAKETGILFSILYASYSLFFHQGLRQRTKVLFLSIIPLLLYLVVRTSALGSDAFHTTNYAAVPPDHILTATLAERLLTMPKIIYFYLSTFIFPANLTEQYWFVKTITLTDFVWPLLFVGIVLGAFVIGGIHLTKKRAAIAPAYWYFMVWFLVGIGLHLQIIPLDKTVATRWFYFPIIGLLGVLLVLSQTIKITSSVVKQTILTLFIVVVVIFSVRSIVRMTNWYSNLTLFSHDIAYLQNNANAQYNYGTALLDSGQVANAIPHLQGATALSPKSYQAWHNLGIAYLRLNKLDEAKGTFYQVLKLKNGPEPYRSLVYVQLMKNNPQEAKQESQDALKQWPEDPFLWRMLGLAEYKLGNTAQARSSWEKSLSIAAYPITQYYLYQLGQNLPIEIKEL